MGMGGAKLRAMMRLLVAVAVAVAAVFVVGCGAKADPRSGPAPAAFDPERFTDIPFPPGYVPKAGEDQLAVSYADGALRRYHVVLAQSTDDEQYQDDELGEWYRRRLEARGWILDAERDEWPRRQVWTKRGPGGQTEQLLLETGRADSRTIIRLVLTPADA